MTTKSLLKPSLSTGELLREVVRLYARAQRVNAACLDGSSTVQCHVLNELLRQEHLTQQTLAERLGLDKGWISRAVDALMAEGFVVRMQNKTDKRSAWLKLTKTGRVRAANLNTQLNQHAQQFLSVVPGEQQARLHASLHQLLQALDKQAANPRDPASCGQPDQP